MYINRLSIVASLLAMLIPLSRLIILYNTQENARHYQFKMTLLQPAQKTRSQSPISRPLSQPMTLQPTSAGSVEVDGSASTFPNHADVVAPSGGVGTHQKHGNSAAPSSLKHRALTARQDLSAGIIDESVRSNGTRIDNRRYLEGTSSGGVMLKRGTPSECDRRGNPSVAKAKPLNISASNRQEVALPSTRPSTTGSRMMPAVTSVMANEGRHLKVVVSNQYQPIPRVQRRPFCVTSPLPYSCP